MTTMELRVNMVPEAKGRPRFARSGHVYTPRKTEHFENQIRLAWAAKFPKHTPFKRYVELDLVFIMPRPKAAKGSVLPHEKRPDLDNLIKSVTDALNNLAFEDDSQIYSIQATKWVAAPNERPFIDIKVVAELG